MVIYSTNEAPRTVTARERVAIALGKIEGAQYLLASACADLSPIVGWVPQWTAISRMHDRVKALWYRLNDKRNAQIDKLKLDMRFTEAGK